MLRMGDIGKALTLGPLGVLGPLAPTAYGTKEREAARVLRRAEITILASTFALVGLGLVMIYSTSGLLIERYGSATHFLGKQAVWAALAGVALFVGRGIDYHFYSHFRRSILLATIIMLILVLVFGTKLNGARRWFRIAGVGMQPSDLAKLGAILYLSAFLVDRRKTPADLRRGFFPAFIALGTIVGLIALEPDIGTAFLISCVGGTLLLIGGVRARHIVPAALIAGPLAAGFILYRLDYVRARLLVWLDPSIDPLGKGYHARQSLIALAGGGVFGKGLGQSSQKLFFLPESHGDFIFAIIGEELGLVGAFVVIGIFVAIVLAARTVALCSRDRTGALLATGIALWIGLQAAFNIAVVTASVPTKGIPLPLVSYGGSALVATAYAIGVLLNVSGHGLDPVRRGFGGSASEGGGR
jgi:cell division protein FtsW